VALSLGSAACGVTSGYVVAERTGAIPPVLDGIPPKFVLVIWGIGLTTSVVGLLKGVLLRRLDVVEQALKAQSADKQLDTICETVDDGNFVEAEWHPEGQLKRLKISPNAPRRSTVNSSHPAGHNQPRVDTPQSSLRVIKTSTPPGDGAEPHP
jgi:hypothetical protein